MCGRRSKWICRVCVCFLAVLFAATAHGAAAEPLASPVKVHGSSQLSEQQIVWCLGNPQEFAVAAEALGTEPHMTVEEGKYNFKSPSGVDGSLTEWATSTDARDLSSF